MRIYKYQGAGNDFLIADNRDGSLQLSAGQVARLCDRRYGGCLSPATDTISAWSITIQTDPEE